MPGVLIVEALAQLGCVAMLIKEEYKERFLHIGREIRAVHEQDILLLKDILKEA